MLLPIGVGMLAAQLLPGLSKKLQPLVGGVGNIAMYAMVVATLVGYFPNLLEIIGTGAFLVGLVFVAAAFGLGYLAGFGKDHLEDVGGLGTAQRNTGRGLLSLSRTSAIQTCTLNSFPCVYNYFHPVNSASVRNPPRVANPVSIR